MTKTYKKLQDSKDLIRYLEENKKVKFSSISKDKAEEILILKNYINVITPFKHCFADRDESKNNPYFSLRDVKGHHIYSDKTDFFDYYSYFTLERDDYHTLYKGLEMFEMAFKSMVSYQFIEAYGVTNSSNAKIGFEHMRDRVDQLGIISTGTDSDISHRKDMMKMSFDKHIKNLEDRTTNSGHIIPATDIYIMFDRMYLQELLNIYMLLKLGRKNKVFSFLSKYNLTLGASNALDLSVKIFNLIPIRNCVMHFNSIEILLKYSDYRNKIIRGNSSRKDYEDILYCLRNAANKKTLFWES